MPQRGKLLTTSQTIYPSRCGSQFGRVGLSERGDSGRTSGYGASIQHEINHLSDYKICGQVTNVVGLLIHVGGVTGSLSVGDHCIIHARGGRSNL